MQDRDVHPGLVLDLHEPEALHVLDRLERDFPHTVVDEEAQAFLELLQGHLGLEVVLHEHLRRPLQALLPLPLLGVQPALVLDRQDVLETRRVEHLHTPPLFIREFLGEKGFDYFLLGLHLNEEFVVRGQ